VQQFNFACIDLIRRFVVCTKIKSAIYDVPGWPFKAQSRPLVPKNRGVMATGQEGAIVSPNLFPIETFPGKSLEIPNFVGI